MDGLRLFLFQHIKYDNEKEIDGTATDVVQFVDS
jgi:hypothetical protein